jgi:hypothetical protein
MADGVARDPALRRVDGSTVVWLARRKQPGRAKASSGHELDVVEGE